MSTAIEKQLTIAYRGAIIMLVSLCGFFLVKMSNEFDEVKKTLVQVQLELMEVKTRLNLTTKK